MNPQEHKIVCAANKVYKPRRISPYRNIAIPIREDFIITPLKKQLKAVLALSNNEMFFVQLLYYNTQK